MSLTPTPPEPAGHASQRDEDAQYYRDILHELIDIGADLARTLHRQATAQPSPEPGPEPAAKPASPVPDPTIAFDRIARTLRRTIALARKLSDPAPPAPASERSTERRRAARKQIIRQLEDAIQQRTKGPASEAEAEALHAELYERLDTLDLDDDIDTMPIAEIIAAIRRDLGIAHHLGTRPWKRRTPRDVHDLYARAAQPARTVQSKRVQPSTALPRPFPTLPQRTPTSTGPPRP